MSDDYDDRCECVPNEYNCGLHDLKTLPHYFERAAFGGKRVEIRNYDRQYSIGDTLVLREFDNSPRPGDQEGIVGYTGRRLFVKVTDVHLGLGLAPNYVALSFTVERGENL